MKLDYNRQAASMLGKISKLSLKVAAPEAKTDYRTGIAGIVHRSEMR